MPTPLIHLEHIDYNVCPDCGAPAHNVGVKTSYASDDETAKILEHVNGGRWEYVVFTCGRRDEFIPNFNGIRTERICPHIPEIQLRVRKRKEATDHLLEFVSRLDTDTTFKESLRNEIKHRASYTSLGLHRQQG
jgi:hypothetical protein